MLNMKAIFEGMNKWQKVVAVVLVIGIWLVWFSTISLILSAIWNTLVRTWLVFLPESSWSHWLLVLVGADIFRSAIKGFNIND